MIRDMPEGERPRERLVRYGANTLSNAELIAILLRTGVTGEGVISMSNRLLSEYGGLAGMGRVSYGELCSVNGISEAKACQLLAALELGRRLVSLSPNDRPIIVSPSDVANLLSAEMGFLDQEHLRVLLLSTKSEVLGIHEVYKGTVNSAAVRVAEVLRPAIRENCPSIIVVHNHPSGDPAPSSQDIMITRQINQAAEMMDIELLDHIIIGGQNHLSMKNKGLGFRAS
jgi:DNA repair protein RadC